MVDPGSLTTAIDNATKVAGNSLFTTVIDKITGFKISQWAAEGEVRKQLIRDEYEKAKANGIMGVQYIEQLRNTTNLIDTATKSAKYIEEGKNNEIEMDNDFFWNTIEHSKSISNDEMQELVAKIIAGEYNQPGTYSMSTLQTIKMLGKTELELFEVICGFIIHKSKLPHNLFSRPDNDNIKPLLYQLNVDYGRFQLLQSLGLFLPNAMSKTIDNSEKNNFVTPYFDQILRFEPTHDTNFAITLPDYYSLSETGKQILKHINPVPYPDYYDWLRTDYKITNYKLQE